MYKLLSLEFWNKISNITFDLSMVPIDKTIFKAMFSFTHYLKGAPANAKIYITISELT